MLLVLRLEKQFMSNLIQVVGNDVGIQAALFFAASALKADVIYPVYEKAA